jgi:hypothetical protein
MTKVEGGGVPVGTQLNGIYEIDERVAMGGMGEVYIGHNIQTGDKLAIKMILPEHAHNQIILDLFRKEASTLNRLYHEAIVRYYVFSVDPTLDRPYLAMEYAAGPSLVDRLRERPLSDDELDLLRHRVASGLHAAHKLGVFHRDISPDNVILVDGKVENAKIIDFGIAKSTSAEGTLIGGGFAGKLNYVSPEQLGLGGGEVTGKSDIYSLGLVLAEAAIGKPLPMGGTQVEVLEKRRAVPDLSEVPARIRPLIEWMLQPEPGDRPMDMSEVANWGQPVRESTAPPHRAAPPRKGAPGAGQPQKKRGFPWLATGVVAAAAAGGAVFFVMQGGEPPAPVPPSGGEIALRPSLQPGEPGLAAATLAAPQSGEVSAKRATRDHTYTWVSPAFEYSGDKAALKITFEGELPPGLEFENGGDATGVLFGIPKVAGEHRLRIKAVSPEGQEAVQTALLVVDPAPSETVPAAPTTPPAPPAEAGAGSAEPSIALKLPALQPIQPMTGGADAGASGVATDGLAGGGAVASGLPELPRTGAVGGDSSALGNLPVASGESDPGAGSAEPSVALNVPTLQPGASAGAGGNGLGAAADPGGLQLPRTGSAAPEALGQPVTEPSDQPLVAVIPPQAENLPPKVLDHILVPVNGSHGEEINLRLGGFDDEEGAGSLTLRVEGRLPNGMQFINAGGGVAQLYGRPVESGNFSFEVVAVDPQGLVSKFPVSLGISAPAAFRELREYITGYKGGDCFLSRPLELAEQAARIEVFVAEADPLYQFDGDFKRDRGFEAAIEGRLITQAQCGLMHALDQVGPHALDNRLRFRIVQDQLRSGETLEGVVEGGADARLFLYDNEGGVTDLAEFVTPGPGGAAFRLPLNGDGPQVLIAATPEAASGLGASAGLEQLLGAAKRGQAALALGYIVVAK